MTRKVEKVAGGCEGWFEGAKVLFTRNPNPSPNPGFWFDPGTREVAGEAVVGRVARVGKFGLEAVKVFCVK